MSVAKSTQFTTTTTDLQQFSQWLNDSSQQILHDQYPAYMLWLIFSLVNALAGLWCIFAVLRPSGVAGSKIGAFITAAMLADTLASLTFGIQAVYNIVGYVGSFRRVCDTTMCFQLMWPRMFFMEIVVKFIFVASFDRLLRVSWPRLYDDVPATAYKISVIVKVLLAELAIDLLGYWFKFQDPPTLPLCSLSLTWLSDTYRHRFTRDLLLVVARLAPLAIFTLVYTIALYKADKKGEFGLKTDDQEAKRESKVNKCVLFMALHQVIIYWARLSLIDQIKSGSIDAYADLLRINFGMFCLLIFSAVIKYRRD